MAFKILRKNCCGLDVHKTWIYACIGITDSNGRTEYKQARFSSFSKGLQGLAEWLAKYSCSDVCMESTGKYWIPVFNILEKTCWVTLAHPKYTKPQKGNKTDRKDAKWICDLYMCGMVKPSFIPPPDIRQLRDLMRYRLKLTNMLTGEKNRAQNCLTVSNLKLDDVFSNVFENPHVPSFSIFWIIPVSILTFLRSLIDGASTLLMRYRLLLTGRYPENRLRNSKSACSTSTNSANTENILKPKSFGSQTLISASWS